ncbi:MAG: glycoside hydrolase family 3 protein [Parvularculaceae bacterium]
MRNPSIVALAAVSLLTAAGSAAAQTSTGSVDSWPKVASPYGVDAAVEEKIDAIISRMSLAEKVGQITMAEIQSISPADVKRFHIGGLLNGGGSYPNKNRNASVAEWLVMANAFYDASMDTGDGKVAVPVLWGTDAVHGHNNVVGATIFPHNIGLGAMRNPAMMRDIGVATAREVAVTGIGWAFAPTVAVARDDRWGRTYESYSEDPALVADYAKEIVVGLQGHPVLGNAFGPDKVVATAKHFIGDGGTLNGDDQGDTQEDEEALKKIHAPGHFTAIGAGAQTVMATFNSWNGVKTHGNRYLLTTVLKDRLGFDGFVVGDWNGHEQLPGCSAGSCAAALNAGVDMIMVPAAWSDFIRNTIKQVKSGDISEARLDDAVRRILRVKLRAGLFEKGRPSAQPLAGATALMGHPDHRALARRAVRESLVLLKNDNVLPLNPGGKKILVTGDAANSLSRQSGGWTLTWQGRDLSNADFPGATSIYAGIREAVEAGGGKAVLSETGEFASKPDAAIVIFGETPYAEFEGDLENDRGVDFEDERALLILRRLRAAGVPTVAIFLSGRPRWVTPEIEAAGAFVAAWLPGSEGAGIADVLIAGADGRPRHDFKGKLSFSWPKTPDQNPVNVGDAGYAPLYPFGFGLRYDAAP